MGLLSRILGTPGFGDFHQPSRSPWISDLGRTFRLTFGLPLGTELPAWRPEEARPHLRWAFSVAGSVMAEPLRWASRMSPLPWLCRPCCSPSGISCSPRLPDPSPQDSRALSSVVPNRALCRGIGDRGGGRWGPSTRGSTLHPTAPVVPSAPHFISLI